jgi:hypothetical protein
LGDEEIRREHNEVKTDKKENCRRQYFTEFVQKPVADPTRDPVRYPDRRGESAVIMQDGLGSHDRFGAVPVGNPSAKRPIASQRARRGHRAMTPMMAANTITAITVCITLKLVVHRDRRA